MTSKTALNTAKGTKLNIVGTRPIRHDGYEKVTGRAKYGTDMVLPQMLYGKVLRSPHPHAKIRSIDTTKALAMPGVQAVVTGADFPILKDEMIQFGEIRGNVRMLAENVLARNKALYRGQAIAAIAATSPHIAEEALELIEVDYEVLPYVVSWEDAMKPGAPLLHADLTTRKTHAFHEHGLDTMKSSNIAFEIKFERGDVYVGFEQADVVVEREFRTASVHQGYIEPHASTALWSVDGSVTIWTSTQAPFSIKAETAMILGISESKVKVIPLEIGGGFGGKLDTYLDPVAALLSKKSGRAVKIVMTRKEVFEGTGPTSASYFKAKIGATRDGKVTGASLTMIYEAGAFPGSPVGEGAMTSFAFYEIPNLLVEGFDVVCNKQKVAAYRAPGAPAAAFAVESVVDELAKKLDFDPIDFRIKNAARTGDRMPSGVPHPPFDGVELLKAMREHPHYKTPLLRKNRGRGVAVGYWFNASIQSSATIAVNGDGTINLVTGSVDIGGTRATLAMQAAEVLGLEAEDVRPSVADTDSIGWTGVTGGSRTAVDTGMAAIQAAEDVKRQMKARAAILWEVSPEDVEFERGMFACLKDPTKRLSFRDLAKRLPSLGGLIFASATSTPFKTVPSIAGNIVDVEVDPETGKVDVLRFTVFQDVGRAGHPSYVEGQMQGGSVQGIGWALNEEYVFTEGRMMNPTYLDYRMPTSLDLPMIDTVILEVPNPYHHFGLRGVGEVSIVPPMAAIGNAVSAALGVRMNRLPMSPEYVLATSRAQRTPSNI